MSSTFARAAFVTSALGLAAFASAGTAGAITSQADTAFLHEIADEGITYESAAAVIGNAHQVCSELTAGATGKDVGLDILAHTDLSTRQSAAFVVLSIDYYCPQYTGTFGR